MYPKRIDKQGNNDFEKVGKNRAYKNFDLLSWS